MKKTASRALSAEQQAELAALAVRLDDEIDRRGMPEVKDWSGAERGVFYRPVKRQLTLRLDADVIDWFRSHPSGGRGYQTRINRVLRDYVEGRDRG